MSTKLRPALPEEYQKTYNEIYKNNREGEGIASFLSQKTVRSYNIDCDIWTHPQFTRGFGKNQKSSKAGGGTILPYPMKEVCMDAWLDVYHWFDLSSEIRIRLWSYYEI